jgi:hypothetical protein
MSNVIQGGFRVWGSITGGQGVFPSPMVQEVASGYATQINVGDIIIPVSDGTVAQSANNSTTLLGVVIGCSYIGTSGSDNGKRVTTDFIPASTTFSPSTVGSPNASLVEYVPLTGDVILWAQGAAATATTAATNITFIGNNVPLTYNSLTPSTVLGRSVACLDLANAATSAKQFRIIGIPGYTLQGFRQIDIDFTSAGVPFLVTCNQGFLPPYTTTGI